MTAMTLKDFLYARLQEEFDKRPHSFEEVESSYRMIEASRDERTLKVLASPYARHPEFRSCWR